MQVEASQSMIRIVGLSATLPNYKDVGLFLGVNVDTGLFYFDASYRPVPLEMQFVGVTEKNIMASKNIMDELAYQKVHQHRALVAQANKSPYHVGLIAVGADIGTSMQDLLPELVF
jgi:replicative superfamily II helicase